MTEARRIGRLNARIRMRRPPGAWSAVPPARARTRGRADRAAGGGRMPRFPARDEAPTTELRKVRTLKRCSRQRVRLAAGVPPVSPSSTALTASMEVVRRTALSRERCPCWPVSAVVLLGGLRVAPPAARRTRCSAGSLQVRYLSQAPSSAASSRRPGNRRHCRSLLPAAHISSASGTRPGRRDC